MYQVRSAAGLDSYELQLRWRKSPGLYSSSPPMMTGAIAGRTSTSRSPYLLSVLNMGASVLTSHLYLPVLARLVLTRWMLVALLRA